MRPSFFSTILAIGGSQLTSAAALPQEAPSSITPPALPLSAFEGLSLVTPITLEEALAGADNETETEAPPGLMRLTAAAATCSNPRVRVEWDSYSDGDRQAYVDAVKCLMNRGPSGQFAASRSRYEDLVALHQTLTPNVHSNANRVNAKFLIWHRYYLWTFEDMLRSECGFNRAMPWFDETRYAGRFSQSSIFSSRWFGGIALGGNCVTDGVSN